MFSLGLMLTCFRDVGGKDLAAKHKYNWITKCGWLEELCDHRIPAWQQHGSSLAPLINLLELVCC